MNALRCTNIDKCHKVLILVIHFHFIIYNVCLTEPKIQMKTDLLKFILKRLN